MSDEEADSDLTCEVFKSNRGGFKLYVGGYTFDRNRVVNNRTYWLCEMRRNQIYQCRTPATTVHDKEGVYTLAKPTTKHNHGPDPLRKKIADFKEKLREDCIAGENPSEVLQTIQNSVDSSIDVLEHLPSTSALRQMLYRNKIKNLDNSGAEEPYDVHFEVNEAETKINGESFIIKDRIFDGNKRVMLLSTLDNMSLLSKADYWVLDGTKVVQAVFNYLHTIHGNIAAGQRKTFPLLFCISTDKDEVMYDAMFDLIKEYGAEKNLNLAPKMVILGYESAAISSLRCSFENVVLQGSNFHLAHIIFRQVQGSGLSKKFASDHMFNKEVKCLLALSYLKSSEITLYFVKLLENMTDPDSKNIAFWFGEVFVSGTSNGPEYPPDFWGRDHITSKVPRSQISAEAWHHKVNDIVDRLHPGFYKLVDELIKAVVSNNAEIGRILTGEPPEKKSKKKRKTNDKDEQVDKILENQYSFPEFQLLMSIAGNFGVVELFQGGQHRQHAAMMAMAMLGFYFECSRHDRDKFIRVHTRHVRADKLHHFEKIRSDATLHLPYDYRSATHPAWQFWRHLGRTGISTVATYKEKDPDGSVMKQLGQNDQLLSDFDLIKINSIYGVKCFQQQEKTLRRKSKV